VLTDWQAKTPWGSTSRQGPAIRSNTSVCMKVGRARDHRTAGRGAGGLRQDAGGRGGEGRPGYDLGAYRDAPAGLRICVRRHGGGERRRHLTQWLDWAFAETKASLAKAA